MRRTQIYLSDGENRALAREAQRTGESKSKLIRKAIAAYYLGRNTRAEVVAVLRRTAGAWRHDVDGAAYVEGLRRGRLKARVQ